MTRDQILSELAQSYQKRREENLSLYEKRTLEACERCPGLRGLLDGRRAALMLGVKRSLLSDQKKEDVNSALPNQMAQYNQKIAKALKDGGFAPDFLAPVYDCPICKDDGYLYEPERHMCACMEKALRDRMLDQLSTVDREQTFENFDLSLFSTEKLDGVSQSQVVKVIKDKCQRFADEYPKPHTVTNNLLLLGKSGLGKTYLMNCIINRVAQRGFLPEYVTAYQLLDAARKAYFGNNEAQLEPYMQTGLLLIDDLGTEPLIDNVTVVQLFNLLSQRHAAGLSTIISTNFSLSEIKDRYTERLASRFSDRSRWTQLCFIGSDVRPRLRRQDAR